MDQLITNRLIAELAKLATILQSYSSYVHSKQTTWVNVAFVRFTQRKQDPPPFLILDFKSDSA